MALQRLYSTFADGWPGSGLLLLRLATATALIHYGIAGLGEASQFAPTRLPMIAAGAGIFLLGGLWTPLAGVLVTSVEVWIVFSRSGDPWIPFILAALGATLAMVGPGAWSIDARLFGRKHIDFPER